MLMWAKRSIFWPDEWLVDIFFLKSLHILYTFQPKKFYNLGMSFDITFHVSLISKMHSTFCSIGKYEQKKKKKKKSNSVAKQVFGLWSKIAG